ncbi:putative MFS monosaccharide transporter [Talaromyces proteolyticus]|uniref:MFS monosaccharide transporter n=1 Tax=Talaromyces proteolyticus TaxID=1131652 RepID=A0AAD4PTE3_9EURO|nr:putative MFS monosaccharide transporter [Talaromyces proteolyticus]KAH8693165.1 putative MFS monosaccharide transporter [Talaromyces proteolyticus]
MDDRGMPTLVVTIIFFVLASTFVALRFISRLGVVHKIAWHDHLMLVAWVIDFGFVFAICYGTTKGLGLHQTNVEPSWDVALNTTEYVANVLYNPALMALKMSILIFFLSLSKTDKVFRWAIYATMFVVNASGFALTMVNVFQCRPVSAAIWFPVNGDAKCTDIVTIYLSSAPVNLITDIAIFLLPVPILTKLRLPKKQKVILIITFSFGFFTAIVDVIRVAYLQNAATSRAQMIQTSGSSTHNTKFNQDFSWYGAFTFMWSAIEVNIGIMCACVPGLKPLVARLVPRMIRGSTDTSPQAASIGTYPSSANRATGPCLASTQRQTLRPGSRANTNDVHNIAAISPPPAAITPEEFMNAADVLSHSGPSDDTESSAVDKTSGAMNVSRFFDFVNVKQPKSMLAMNNKESIPPVALTTVLFFMWGLGYGFLDVLNDQFKLIDGISAWGSLGLHAAYYGGYLISPLAIGRQLLCRWGFKATFIAGLFIYACGALIFWPSAVLTSFTAFIISNFIVGCGFGVLETAANPFIALCGPLENAEIRLNFSQAIQGVASVVSAVLAKKALFQSVQDAASLVKVQWAYLAIALFDLLLAVAFYYLPVPEATDEDLRALSDRRKEANSVRVLGIPVIWMTFGLGVFSQFCYVGGQEVLVTSFAYYIEAQISITNLSTFDYLLIGRSLFAAGRFMAAFTQWFLKPRWILFVSYTGLIVLSALCMALDGLSGVVIGLLLFLFESGVFSIIFAMSLRGMGTHTKTASAIMATAIGGGTMFPFAQQAASNNHGVVSSYVVLVVLYAVGAIFPLYLNFVPAAKKQVDPIPNEYLRRHIRRHRQTVNVNPSPPVEKEQHYSRGGVLSRPRSLVDEPVSSNVPGNAQYTPGINERDLAFEQPSPQN